jgi:hypothetical protein
VHDRDALAAEQLSEPDHGASIDSPGTAEEQWLDSERPCVVCESAELVKADEDGLEP